jgi:hypothetical protein
MLCETDRLGAVAGLIRFVPIDEDDIPHLLSPPQVSCQ